MSIDLKKKAEENLINLSKKATISLSKNGLVNVKARTGLALDISASMSSRYSAGVVQRVVERVLGLAMNFDDNGAADVFAFGEKDYTIGEVKKANFFEFVNREILKKHSLEGSTYYAGVLLRAIDYYFPGALIYKKSGFFGGKKELVLNTAKYRLQEPVYLMFVTDGNCFDSELTKEVIIKASELGIFFQFIGVGNEQFTFLKTLDNNLPNRLIDNANFLHVSDIDRVSDEELYDAMLKEFPMWIKEARTNGLIH